MGVDLLIVVTLGTQKQSFKRLLDYVEGSNIQDEIIVQAGYTKYESEKMKIFDFIPQDELNSYIEKADFLITHGGTGSIIEPLKMGKKIIACSRLKKYKEHIDDHQQELVVKFAEEGYILFVDEENSLDEQIEKISSFKPKKYVSNTEEFLKKLKEEIRKED